MTHKERLIVDREVGELFCDLEPVSDTLMFIANDLLAPDAVLGPAERDTLEALIRLCGSHLVNALACYDMKTGRTETGRTQYILELAHEAEAAKRIEQMHSQSC